VIETCQESTSDEEHRIS